MKERVSMPCGRSTTTGQQYILHSDVKLERKHSGLQLYLGRSRDHFFSNEIKQPCLFHQRIHTGESMMGLVVENFNNLSASQPQIGSKWSGLSYRACVHTVLSRRVMRANLVELIENVSMYWHGGYIWSLIWSSQSVLLNIEHFLFLEEDTLTRVCRNAGCELLYIICIDL